MAGIWERAAKYKYLLLLLVLGLGLLLWPTGGGGDPDSGRTEREARLETAGRVSVLYSDEGVAVVCEGASSARVRLDVVKAVSAYTGLGSDRIEVLGMER